MHQLLPTESKGRFKRVLIIEAEVDLGLLLRAYFLRKNYDVQVCRSVYNALQQMGTVPPDYILILTKPLPGEMELVARLRQLAPDAVFLP